MTATHVRETCPWCGAYVGWCNPHDGLHEILRRHQVRALCWSELPPGWLALLDDALGQAKALGFTGYVDQIKEKWGVLDLGFLFEQLHDDSCSLDSTAGCTCGADAMVAQHWAAIGPALDTLTKQIAQRSRTICMTCGAPGTTRVLESWIMVCCPAHAG